MTKTEHIIDTARHMFMRYGIKSVTMDDIAREMGISKKTLYQHVSNKTDLLDRVIDQHIKTEKESLQQITGESRDAIDEQLSIARYVLAILRQMRPTTMFDMKKYHRECWRKMDEFHLDYVYGVIRSNIERGRSEGLYREDVNADVIAKLYVGKTMLLADEQMFPAQNYDRDSLFLEYIQYHLRGILSEKGLKKLKSYQPIS
ncbi:MAG: TetR/AcrR family transcriptional regulator [Saprospiraceae bacterium]|nr:TetR/AcrR family transcriptional regulator [Saprospiraceae bacterium]